MYLPALFGVTESIGRDSEKVDHSFMLIEKNMNVKTPSILIVEEDSILIENIIQRFESYTDNCDLHTAGSISEAEKLINEVNPNLILSNVNLPDGRGTELLTINKNNHVIPFLFIKHKKASGEIVLECKDGIMGLIHLTPEKLENLPHISFNALSQWNEIKTKNLHLQLDKRNAYFDVVSSAAVALLKETDWRLCIDALLEKLGVAFNVDHIKLVIQHNKNSHNTTDNKYEWSNPQINKEQLTPIQKNIKNQYDNSAIVIPLYEGDPIEGYIRLESFSKNRDWTMNEIKPLKAFANILEATLTRYDIDSTEQNRYEKMLNSIVKGTSLTTGRKFFRSVVKHLAVALDLRFVLVGELMDSKKERVNVLSIWNLDKFDKNFEYDLHDTPCQDVIGKKFSSYTSRIQELFPKDNLLVEMNIEGYMGVPLISSSGETLGLIAILHDKPIPDKIVSHTQSLLSIFAARTAAELERIKTEDELKNTAAKLSDESKALIDKNIALKEILKHLEQEKVLYKHEICTNIENLITPFIKKIRRNNGTLNNKDIDLLENHFNSSVGKDIDQFLNNYRKLSPRELDICERIKDGMSAKEIATSLNISINTVNKHRESIREKLQLKYKNINLSAFLRTK